MRQEPFTREEFTDWGIRIRVRYHAIATERQRVSSDIVDLIFEKFKRCDKLRFCYPHSEIIYRPQQGQLDLSVADHPPLLPRNGQA